MRDLEAGRTSLKAGHVLTGHYIGVISLYKRTQKGRKVRSNGRAQTIQGIARKDAPKESRSRRKSGSENFGGDATPRVTGISGHHAGCSGRRAGDQASGRFTSGA